MIAQVDVRLNGFDVLPDVIGYLIAAQAAWRLRRAHHAFAAAAAAALAASPVSLAALSPHAAGRGSKTGNLALDALLALADLVIVWCACTGVIGAAARAGASDLAAMGRRRRVPIVAVSAVWLLSPVLGPALARLPLGVAAALAIGYAALGVAALLLLVGLLRRAGRTLGAEPAPA